MKLLLVSDDYWPNLDGGALFERRLANSLAAIHEVRVWAPSTTGPSGVQRDGGTVITRVASRSLKSNSRYRVARLRPLRLWQEFRRWKPDVIHVHNAGWLGLCAMALARIFGVARISTNHMTVQQVALSAPRLLRNVVLEKIFGSYLAWFNNKFDAVIVPSAYARRLALELGVESPVSIISNGVDVDYFIPGILQIGESQVDAPLRIVYVGRLDADKEVGALINLFKSIKSKVAIDLTVVGEGSCRTELENLVHRDAKRTDLNGLSIVFTGPVPEAEKRAYLQKADLFCLSSRWELQCIAALEAMACGTALLVADAGALPELCPDGSTGWLFDPFDADDLVRLIGSMTREEIAIRGEAARAFVTRRHSNEATVAQYERLYTLIVDEPEAT
ncbi:glycosyltransferase [Streptomyces sp. NBC_00038]|uniref:glycosyltransferase n=1 Tax=Streptomyces sp. NBC_00038 TaxID=2903615 RepID=UPI00224F8080|nr:glycosyltransferase [Streptomyces sp. NBC_00038]MCX5561941.1 glycosyltransferase [Streptomyces sp. NBC_00038]